MQWPKYTVQAVDEAEMWGSAWETGRLTDRQAERYAESRLIQSL